MCLPARTTVAHVLLQIIEVNQEELEVALTEREKPMIIDFYADWYAEDRCKHTCRHAVFGRELPHVYQAANTSSLDSTSGTAVYHVRCNKSTVFSLHCHIAMLR